MADVHKHLFELKKHWEENKELEAVIVDMSNDGAPNQVTKPDIEEDQRRWLIISLCLHNVVSPALRTYVRPIVEAEYKNFKKSHKIDAQQFPNYLKKYPPTKKDMNYESINNNKQIPKVNRKSDFTNFDFRVKDAVDFTKLFLQTHMVHYTGFDDTCDQSALLGIIANMDSFPQLLKVAADKLRTEVRNPWAHVNFTEWDTVKYQTCFQLMTQVIKNMALPRMQFLNGTTIGLELLERLITKTKALAAYIKGIERINYENFETCRNAVANISLSLDSSVQGLKQKDAELEYRADTQATILKQVSKNVDDVKSTVAHSDDNICQLRQQFDLVTKESDETRELVHNTKSDFLQKVEGMAKDIENTHKDIDTIKRNMSHDRPPNMPFFYPPNRLQNFIGRVFELKDLDTNFISNKEKVYTQAICGLGGIGKTTIASEYAWRSADFYVGGIFWLDGENTESISDSVHRLAIDTGTTGQNAQETLHKTTRWLSMVQQKWLLVIDNVDADDISGMISELLLGSWKRESKGHLLITTRRESAEAEEDFQVSTDCCLTLEVFTCQESINFMQIRTGLDVKNECAYVESIIEELGGLPLALEQAAAHIKSLKRFGGTFKQYLEKFKKQRLKFLKVSQRSKARLAVQTTWELNFEYVKQHSDEMGVGNAAVALMYISAFWFADDIPQALINVGSPANITDENLCDILSDDIGPKQIMEILTRFSLFQQKNSDSVSVHRLVQEIVREKVTDTMNQKDILRNAARMIHFALSHCKSPGDVLKSDSIERGSLRMWNRLAIHANVLKTYIINFSKSNADEMDVCFNLETAYLMQTSAIYHSLLQRQDEALAAQDQMLTILTTIEVTDKDCRELTLVKIPLLSDQKLLIENATSAVITDERQPEQGHESMIDVDVEGLRMKGNAAFREKRYQNAIQYYTEIVKSTSNTQLDAKVYSERSLAYLRNKDFQNALRDADECIQIDPTNWKAYCWKAYSIANLIRLGQLEHNWESVGLAAASVARYYNKDCLMEFKMRIEYPVVSYKVIANKNELNKQVSSLMNMSFTTLLLKKGVYNLTGLLETGITKSVQIIGIEDSVEINEGLVPLVFPRFGMFTVDYRIPCCVSVHIENVTFVENSGQVFVDKNVVATFLRCTFSNGQKACENYPKCDGNEGCRNERKGDCAKHFKLEEGENFSSGAVGYPGVVARNGGQVYLKKCKLIRCGGGGALSIGKGSLMNVQNCLIMKMHNMGVEARNGGLAEVIECEIRHNQSHGIAIGPEGRGYISGNTISDNGQEGIWAGGVLLLNYDGKPTAASTDPSGGSICTITENIICNNGKSGISFDGGIYTVRGNRIFDNWLWGLMAKSRSSVNIENNDIFKNKCGGIRIGVNYSAVVFVDGNTIRDHTGPGIFSLNAHENDAFLDEYREMNKKFKLPGVIEDEVEMYSVPLLMTTRNLLRDNDLGIQHPQQMLQVVQTCCQCAKPSDNLKTCGRCKKAAYCSKKCQREHWRKHKHMCEILLLEYNIDIQMLDTKDTKQTFGWTRMPKKEMMILRFESPLPGIGKGKPPERKSSERFIVQIQSGKEYNLYDPETEMLLYDQSLTVDILLKNPKLYHLVQDCGLLSTSKFTTKKIFCWASFKNKGTILSIYTANLPKFQTW
ncbi:HSOP1-like protein [Mya arenaria]|uniref:HSOP1-like protein n=1 Tax=Mya arenaria TaxID=6604 RepID=A0ABY7EFV0_MYAAR|nr:HSOP1-like protein [Mya arenaria]